MSGVASVDEALPLERYLYLFILGIGDDILNRLLRGRPGLYFGTQFTPQGLGLLPGVFGQVAAGLLGRFFAGLDARLDQVGQKGGEKCGQVLGQYGNVHSLLCVMDGGDLCKLRKSRRSAAKDAIRYYADLLSITTVSREGSRPYLPICWALFPLKRSTQDSV